MYTIKLQKIIDAAKYQAFIQGLEEITLDILLDTVQQSEGRILLARCLKMDIRPLKDQGGNSERNNTMSQEKLEISKEVHDLLVIAKRFANQVPDRSHPGFMDIRHLICAVAISRQACSKLNANAIPEKDAAACLLSWYDSDEDVPVMGELSGRLRKLRSDLLEKVYGQDHAVQAFVEGLFNAELLSTADQTRKKPQAIFVFAGPPGVGKTFLAELGAEALNRPFKRFDMSAYSDHQQYMDLIGFPPSYQAAKAGVLTGYVKENPNAFLLFDEIEKAHLTTINLFLQILDAGRLEDKFTNELVTFKDTIIIFTTNAGASLYDRLNETGVSTANSSFHRHTILDALRTEKNASGSPAFPQAICSRLSTGYPLLFNHLGINELEKIVRSEIHRVSNIIEGQYFKIITYDDLLPLALVLREGISADARTVRSQSSSFVQSELYKLTELYTPRRLEHILTEVDTIHFEFDHNNNDEEILSLFTPMHKPKVLLISSSALGNLYAADIVDVEWLVADTEKDAIKILADTEVDFVLLDIWFGKNKSESDLGRSVKSFDFVPIGASSISGGLKLLRQIHERLSNIPVFLLSFLDEKDSTRSVDASLLQAFILNGGARGVCQTAFINDFDEGVEEKREEFTNNLISIASRVYHEKKANQLGQERKVLGFDTIPGVERSKRSIIIRIKNLRLTRAVESADVGDVIQNVERPSARFSDVYGADSAKEAMMFLVDWLKNPRRYAALGVRPPRGILLTGSPGTGKTMLARSVAGESDAAFLVASGTDFVTIWQGSGPQNIRELFARARRYAPSIVFIDEIDAVGKKRTGGEGGGRAEENTLNALLTEMDGFGAPTLKPVIVLAATNLANHLDDALRRRFDREIEVPLPDRKARLAFLTHELADAPYVSLSNEVLESIASRSAGMTIADLRRLVNETAVVAARRVTGDQSVSATSPDKQAPLITDAVLEETFEKLRVGDVGKTPDAETLERIARHESGHALVGWLLHNPIVQITIIGRGNAGGYVEREAQEEKMIYTRPELEGMICQSMGGRAAEILYYGENEGLSTGVASDLQQASSWAGRMIREFGMSEEVGQIFIDQRSLEGNISAQVNQCAEKIVHAQLDQALDLLTAHRAQLDVLTRELLDKNRLSRAEMEQILESNQ